MHKYEPVFYLLLLSITSLSFNSGFSPNPRGAIYTKNLNVGLSKSDQPTENQNANFEILLGQTKYYQAITCRNRLVIMESTKPELQGGASDVTFEVVKESRDKLGVYYDNKDEQGNDLPLGMIRLIGSYWDGGEPFKVRLTAKKRSSPLFADIGYTISQFAEMRECYDVASVIIDVQAPYRLGTASNTITDCFGNSIDIDELIIKFAGENGIPPQLIKGMMEQESSFKPAWRYEPFQDAQREISDGIFKNNKFVVTDNSMGGSFPTNHTNVEPDDYNKTQIIISNYLIKYWKDYVQPGAANKPDIILGSGSDRTDNLTEKWKERWTLIKGDKKIRALLLLEWVTFGP